MSLHYPQGYRYRSASKAGNAGGEQGSDSDVAELSDLEDDEDEDRVGEAVDRRVVVEEDEDGEDDEDDEDDDDEDDDEDEEEEGEGLPYPGFVPIALRYLDQTTRPRNWCLALITNPYPFATSQTKAYYTLELDLYARDLVLFQPTQRSQISLGSVRRNSGLLSAF